MQLETLALVLCVRHFPSEHTYFVVGLIPRELEAPNASEGEHEQLGHHIQPCVYSATCVYMLYNRTMPKWIASACLRKTYTQRSPSTFAALRKWRFHHRNVIAPRRKDARVQDGAEV